MSGITISDIRAPPAAPLSLGGWAGDQEQEDHQETVETLETETVIIQGPTPAGLAIEQPEAGQPWTQVAGLQEEG